MTVKFELNIDLTSSDDIDTPVLVILRCAGQFGPQALAVDAHLSGAASRALAAPRFKGHSGEITDILAPTGVKARRVLVLNLGPAAAMTARAVTEAGAALARHLEAEAEPEAHLLFEAPLDGALAADEILGRLVLGAKLRNYRFAMMARDEAAADLTLQGLTAPLDQALLQRFSAVSEGVALARDLVNLPASHLHPDNFGAYLAPLRQAGIAIEELQTPDLERLGMGAVLAVGNGSDRKPRVFTLTYKGEGATGQPLALVGKGMCFDAGGMCIKTGPQMYPMKGDMGGAAAVIGTMLALAQQKSPLHVVGVLGVAENMLAGNAYKPGDVVTSMSGRTIEVFDTDCEGRMVLADVLHYAATRFDPCAIVDLATLTYSVTRGLGHVFAGLFSTHDVLADGLLAAGEATGERFWRLPLDPAYNAGLRSEIADLRQHSPDLEDGDAPFAAAFLKHFVEGKPWVHLDIAGKEFATSDRPLCRVGASGFGVQLLEEWITQNAASLHNLG